MKGLMTMRIHMKGERRKARQREEEQDKIQLLEAEAEGLSGRADANKR